MSVSLENYKEPGCRAERSIAHHSLPQPLHLRVTFEDQEKRTASLRFEQVIELGSLLQLDGDLKLSCSFCRKLLSFAGPQRTLANFKVTMHARPIIQIVILPVSPSPPPKGKLFC